MSKIIKKCNDDSDVAFVDALTISICAACILELSIWVTVSVSSSINNMAGDIGIYGFIFMWIIQLLFSLMSFMRWKYWLKLKEKISLEKATASNNEEKFARLAELEKRLAELELENAALNVALNNETKLANKNATNNTKPE